LELNGKKKALIDLAKQTWILTMKWQNKGKN